MSVPRRHLSALAFSVIFTTGTELAFSGQDEIVMIGGAGFALVVVEKCTGVAPPADYIPRIRAGITRAGISDEDFRQGFASGAMKAEMKYRGKPPAQECKDAKTLKAQIDKAFL